MPRCPYKGTLVYNKVLKRSMHKVADFTYKNGEEYGIYSDMMPVMVKILKDRIKRKFQNNVIISGGTGRGKSSLGIQYCKAIDPGWVLKDGYAYFKDEALEILSDEEKKIALIDETTNVLNALDYRNKEDNTMVIQLDTMRSYGRTIFYCAPNFRRINKSLRDDHADYLFALPYKPLVRGYSDRGFYLVYVPIRDTFMEEPFWMLAGAGVYGPLDEETDAEYSVLKKEKQQRKNAMVRKKVRQIRGEEEEE